MNGDEEREREIKPPIWKFGVDKLLKLTLDRSSKKTNNETTKFCFEFLINKGFLKNGSFPASFSFVFSIQLTVNNV